MIGTFVAYKGSNMKVKCLPMGTIPYDNIDYAARMVEKLFEKNPALFLLPKLSEEDNVEKYTLKGFPCTKFKDGKYLIKTSTSASEGALEELDQDYNNLTLENMEKYSFETVFMKKYLAIIKKYKCPNATFNLLGPYTISQKLHNVNKGEEDLMLITEKLYKKLFVQAICMKALWFINEIKKACPTTKPIVVLEEPMLNKIGNMKRESEVFTEETLIGIYSKIVEKLKEAGAMVAVHSTEKSAWQVPIKAGVDIISFDAYNNPNNLCIIPEIVTDYLENGGKINWAIIPVISESAVKALSIDFLTTRLINTMQGLILAGVPEHLVYNHATVSTNGNTDKLPIIFSEKALMLSTQLAKKIPTVKN
ncbi:MAG: hypothetical protein MJ231_03525 [bacterium]|nr:hypothetical protein [bacterium]